MRVVLNEFISLLRAVIAATVLAALPSIASAQPASMGPWRTSAGLAVVFPSNPYAGRDGDPMVVPSIGYEGDRVFLRGIIAGVRVARPGEFQIDVLARPRFSGYEAEDSPVLAGMEDRAMSADAGLQFGWRRGPFGARATWMADVLGRSGGSEIGAEVFAPIPAGPVRLQASLGAQRLSSPLANYYYGVRESEATADRPFHETGSAVNPYVGLQAIYNFGRWTAGAIARTEWLDDSIANSPIVENRTSIGGVLTLARRF